MSVYQCSACYFPYDEEAGRPEDGIPPGTPWEKVPDDWECPDCGNAKSGFMKAAD